MEKKLTIFERAIKNKEKLKLQLISLTLATTAIISTGCTPSEKPNFDDEKPGIEEVVNDYSKEALETEEVEPLTADNFESEVDILMASLQEKGMEISRKEVGTLLLYNNVCEMDKEDASVIVNNSFSSSIDNGYNINNGIDFSNIITKHNAKSSPEKYAGFSEFSHNDKGKAILTFFDEMNIKLKNAFDSENSNSKNEINAICDFACKFCNNEIYLLVDGEETYLTDTPTNVQVLIGKSVLDLANTVTIYDSNNKWLDLLTDARYNDYINDAANMIWEYNPLNPQMSK